MKNLVITVSMLILCSFFLQFQIDVNLLERQTLRVKYTADRMACAASLPLDEERFGQGFRVFVPEEAIPLALECLKGSLGYGSDYAPSENTYFSETAVVELYFFDDSLQMRHYRNGQFIDSAAFAYGDAIGTYVPRAEEAGYGLIERPCVACVIDAGRPRFQVDIAPPSVRVVQSSVYEYR
ncbi:MAG: hypothetical protein HUJ80_03535 [Firmicutes bacterium]|nr:hypothetical protein [Bacillota bacterium]